MFAQKLLPVCVGSLVGLVASMSPASAILVKVEGQSYNITTFTGSPENNPSKFNATTMPWLGDEQLALNFAVQVIPYLPNQNSLDGRDYGPFFTFGVFPTYVSTVVYDYSFNYLVGIFFNNSDTLVYAEAQPVPAPLPIAGAAVVFGMGRRIRSNSKRLSALSAKR